MPSFSHLVGGNLAVPAAFKVARRGGVWILWLSATLWILTAPAFGQIQTPVTAPPAVPAMATLSAGKPIEFPLNPAEKVTLALHLDAGRYYAIRVEQIQGMTETMLLAPDGRASIPYTNDGGVGSLERISVIPSKSGTFHLQIHSRERHLPVLFRVTMEPGRSATPRDSAIVRAQSTLAEAEWMRRKPGSASFPGVHGPGDVLALYDRAFRLAEQAGDKVLEREALIGKARYQIFRIAQYQQGVRTATRATQLPESADDLDQQALAWKTLASALAFVDRYDESIVASRRALEMYRKTGDRYWQGIVLGNMADVDLEIGDSKGALESAKESLAIARELSDDYGVAFTETTIGEIYQGRGEYQSALTAYYHVLDSIQLVSYPQVAGEVWDDLGQLYSQLGDWERAGNAYRHALPILRKDGDGINEIDALNHLGQLALHSGNVGQAQRYFRQGLARAKSQKLVREETFLRIGLAQTCLRMHCSEDPLTTLSLAGQAAQKIHQVDGEAAVNSAVGDVLAARHDDSGSMQAYAQSRALWQSVPNSVAVAAVEAKMARLDVEQGRLPQARLQIYKTLDAVEASRAHIDSDALRTTYLTSKQGYYDLAVNILMRLDRKFPNRGYAEEAWTVAERARARTLLDDLMQGSESHHPIGDEPLRKTSAALEVKIEETENQLSHLASSPADIARGQLLEHSIHRMLLRADQLESRVRAANPAYHALVESSRVSASRFRRTVLDRRTALLEYWTGKTDCYLWVLTRSGVRSFQLPDRRVLDARVDAYRQSLLARDQFVAGEDIQARQLRIQHADARLSVQSKELAAILLPARFGFDIQRILIVADGSLLSMPFAALELPRSTTAASRYLIDRYSLVYEPSAATASTLLAKRTKYSGNRRVAIFADPVYSRSDARVQAVGARSRTFVSKAVLRSASIERIAELPRLPASRNEAEAIARIAGASNTSVFLGFNASPQRVREMDWSRYEVAHFAAHAIVDPGSPEFSGIVLSMVHRNGTPADGILWLHDIYRLHIPVSLVTLSGCETADGKSIPGEGINGLARAFLYSGAHSVMGTLWSADDSSSSELMQSFYREFLDRKHTTGTALRRAQIHVMSDGEHAAPYYWAGFILEGDWAGR